MLQQRRGIGAVGAFCAVKGGAARLGGEAKYHCEVLLCAGCDRGGALRGRQSLSRNWIGDRAAAGLQDGTGREWIGAAGIEENDRDAQLVGEFIHNRGKRYEALIGIVESRKIGIDRNQIVLTPRFDSVTGVIDKRDIGVFGIFGKTAQSLDELSRISVLNGGDLEAEIGQKLLDRPGIVSGIGESGQVLILRLPDHEGDTLESLSLLRLGKPVTEDKQGDERQKKAAP